MPIELTAEPRTQFGKEKCKHLREENVLPCNIYGGSLKESRAIQLDLLASEKLILAHGKRGDYTVALEGATYPVRIQEIRYEPLYKRFQHIDFVVRSDD
jgi:ribosomal protein L25 (general stress protein Ctc)